MKTIFLFGLVVACVLSVHARKEFARDVNGNVIYPDYMFMADDNGKLHYVNLSRKLGRSPVARDEVEIYLYTRANPVTPDFMYPDDPATLLESNFKPSRRSVVIAHGWNNDHTSAVNELIRTASLAVEDCNVFVVDWSSHAGTIDYIDAADSVIGVGDWLGVFVNHLLNDGAAPASSIILTGHSLGAHVVGRAGSNTNQLVNIVGLDPAGPLFSIDDFESRIDQTDGDMVQIIHTCGGLLGFYDAMATVDLYPNGGDSQPGCGIDLIGTCAHSRAYEYYAESIRSGGFSALRCPSWSDFTSGLCASNPRTNIGGLDLDMSASGIYMLATSDAPPFSLGKKN